jgi:hypothetical protein
MIDWIEKNIDPPGMEKKNRGSLFFSIGKDFGIVQKDAEKAYKAHFPYLADLSKLREHGKSLGIPEFPYDSENEFRERVSAASFFLVRAGERAYIYQQLENHFGSHYSLTEKFLELSIKVLDISEEDFSWLWSFFDETLDPNIKYVIGELFDFTETVFIAEKQNLQLVHNEADSFKNIKHNGLIKYDGITINTRYSSYGKYDGAFDYKGFLSYDGIGRLTAMQDYSPPFKYSSGVMDRFATRSVVNGYKDKIEAEDFLTARILYHHLFNGVYQYDGAIKYNSNNPFGIN